MRKVLIIILLAGIGGVYLAGTAVDALKVAQHKQATALSIADSIN